MGAFIGSTVTLLFLFSTSYTLVYLYYLDSNQELTITGLSDDPKDAKVAATSSSGFLGTIIPIADGILELVSWLSPVALIKVLFAGFMQTNTPFLYLLVNLLILRPLGWSMALITLNFIISKIPTVSGES